MQKPSSIVAILDGEYIVELSAYETTMDVGQTHVAFTIDGEINNNFFNRTEIIERMHVAYEDIRHDYKDCFIENKEVTLNGSRGVTITMEVVPAFMRTYERV